MWNETRQSFRHLEGFLSGAIRWEYNRRLLLISLFQLLLLRPIWTLWVEEGDGQLIIRAIFSPSEQVYSVEFIPLEMCNLSASATLLEQTGYLGMFGQRLTPFFFVASSVTEHSILCREGRDANYKLLYIVLLPGDVSCCISVERVRLPRSQQCFFEVWVKIFISLGFLIYVLLSALYMLALLLRRFEEFRVNHLFALNPYLWNSYDLEVDKHEENRSICFYIKYIRKQSLRGHSRILRVPS